MIAFLTPGRRFNRGVHYEGAPPELTGGVDTRREMGTPAYLVIEDAKDGVFLYRYGSDGLCVGDTWHESVNDAMHQAVYEYGGDMGDWQDVPLQVVDAASFGLEQWKRLSR